MMHDLALGKAIEFMAKGSQGEDKFRWSVRPEDILRIRRWLGPWVAVISLRVPTPSSLEPLVASLSVVAALSVVRELRGLSIDLHIDMCGVVLQASEEFWGHLARCNVRMLMLSNCPPLRPCLSEMRLKSLVLSTIYAPLKDLLLEFRPPAGLQNCDIDVSIGMTSDAMDLQALGAFLATFIRQPAIEKVALKLGKMVGAGCTEELLKLVDGGARLGIREFKLDVRTRGNTCLLEELSLQLQRDQRVTIAGGETMVSYSVKTLRPDFL